MSAIYGPENINFWAVGFDSGLNPDHEVRKTYNMLNSAVFKQKN